MAEKATESAMSTIHGDGTSKIQKVKAKKKSLVTFIDTIKVRMQLSQSTGEVQLHTMFSKNPKRTNAIITKGARTGLFRTGYGIVKSESLSALWKGSGPVLTGIVPKMAVRFTSFETYKRLLSGQQTSTLSNTKLLAAAISAGVTEAVVIVTPMDVLKIRLQAIQRSGDQSAFQVLRQMIKYEGFQVLYKGVALTALRQGTNQMANLYTYTKLTDWLRARQTQYQDSRLPIFQLISVGLFAGTKGPLCNGPIDIIKTRVQQSARPPGKGPITHATDLARRIVANEGIQGLYRGVTPRILRVGVGQAVVFPVYELLNELVNKA
ncbi:hypothetical protein BOTNAR_0701g00030 [Botryotinia narcissicola]|uniref:Uncharacterized protein n=1 Tax=Botryotinia narcissicola TaxID=278944 RepID=A0A4Z1H7N6_9HELO|nr:hypothetical protein BOTNAR_0701g00030 [Botryotinia narcissicola]